MNRLDEEFSRVLSVVISCCSTEYLEGKHTITSDEVLSKSKKENASKARTLAIYHLIRYGFTITTIALHFQRSCQAVREMLEQHESWMRSSTAYRVANEQVLAKLNQSNS